MLGLLIGVLCGLVELFLLYLVLRSASSGNTASVLLLILLKLVIFALAFAPLVMFFRDDLIWCGVGTATVLSGGSVFIFFKNAYSKGRDKN